MARGRTPRIAPILGTAGGRGAVDDGQGRRRLLPRTVEAGTASQDPTDSKGAALRTHLIPYLLACASTVATRRVDERLLRYDLTTRQYGLLAQLWREPELTISELARQLGIARQSVHQLVDELVEAGHVRRRPGASERSRRLEITDTAHYLLTRIEGPLEGVEAELLTTLSPTERETLRLLLQRVLAHTTDDEAWLTEE